VRFPVGSAYHQGDRAKPCARQNAESALEEDSSQTLSLHRWTDGDLCEVGVVGSDPGSEDETTYPVLAIAGNEGRRGDGFTTPVPMKDVLQQQSTAIASSIKLIHLGVDTSRMSLLHEARGLAQARWTAKLVAETRIGRNLGIGGLERTSHERTLVLGETVVSEKLGQPGQPETYELALDALHRRIGFDRCK
jgi:hypothetical protein